LFDGRLRERGIQRLRQQLTDGAVAASHHRVGIPLLVAGRQGFEGKERRLDAVLHADELEALVERHHRRVAQPLLGGGDARERLLERVEGGLDVADAQGVPDVEQVRTGRHDLAIHFSHFSLCL
jgi:hypothetical protein